METTVVDLSFALKLIFLSLALLFYRLNTTAGFSPPSYPGRFALELFKCKIFQPMLEGNIRNSETPSYSFVPRFPLAMILNSTHVDVRVFPL